MSFSSKPTLQHKLSKSQGDWLRTLATNPSLTVSYLLENEKNSILEILISGYYSEKERALLNDVVDYYKTQLRYHPDAQRVLVKKSI